MVDVLVKAIGFGFVAVILAEVILLAGAGICSLFAKDDYPGADALNYELMDTPGEKPPA